MQPRKHENTKKTKRFFFFVFSCLFVVAFDCGKNGCIETFSLGAGTGVINVIDPDAMVMAGAMNPAKRSLMLERGYFRLF